jgi:hypothetical protein
LLGVGSTAGPHENIGLWNAQLLEKDIVHLRVIMLAGMDDLEAQPAMLTQSPYNGRYLHEVGACAGN